MKAELQLIFDSTPEDGPRSRLEPYRELILRWRRQGRTYERIRQLLQDRCSVTISRQVLTRFIERRSRPRKPQAAMEEKALVLSPSKTGTPELPSPANPVSTADPYAEARERMRLFKEAPVAAKPRKVFEVPEEDLDGTKPLRMMKPNQPKEK